MQVLPPTRVSKCDSPWWQLPNQLLLRVATSPPTISCCGSPTAFWGWFSCLEGGGGIPQAKLLAWHARRSCIAVVFRKSLSWTERRTVWLLGTGCHDGQWSLPNPDKTCSGTPPGCSGSTLTFMTVNETEHIVFAAITNGVTPLVILLRKKRLCGAYDICEDWPPAILTDHFFVWWRFTNSQHFSLYPKG